MRRINGWMLAGLMLCSVAALWAADTEEPAATQPETEATQPSAEEVVNELLRRRSEQQLIEPVRPAQPAPAAPAPQTLTQPLEGTAPQADKTPLRREGQFVITRTGRMVRANGGMLPWLFVFESDSDGLQDPPMFLMPSRMLEDMEKILETQGEATVFIISGQVFAYHGANYLLPTLMKQAPARGNLQP